MKQLAITLIELNNPECPNIGTIVSNTEDKEELNKKAVEALVSHFDSEIDFIRIEDNLEIIDIKNSYPLDATVFFKEGGTAEIQLQQTFLYL